MSFLFSIATFFALFGVQAVQAETPSAITVIEAPAITGSVPLGAERIPMLQLTFKASCSAPVTIRTLTVHHTGLGSVSNLAKMYAVDGTTRLSRGVVLSSKNATRLLYLHADVTASKRRTIALTVEETSDIETHSVIANTSAAQ
jgi:hypothetical protein